MTGPQPLDNTLTLLEMIRGGSAAAREQLIARYLPILRRWAHGRLPHRARGLADTDDLVQVSLVRALSRMDDFEYRHEGAFLAYLRQVVLNAVREEIRRASRRPSGPPVTDSLPDQAASLVEQAIGRQMLERYERALLELTPDQREAVLLRLEFGLSYPEIAEAMGRAQPNAARMLVVRALMKLTEALGDSTDSGPATEREERP